MPELPAVDPQHVWLSSWTIQDRPLLVDVGDLTLTISRLQYEWRLNYCWTKKGSNGGFSCGYIEESRDGAIATGDRIATESSSGELTLLPRLADRPVVVRPSSPLQVPGNNRITLYVSTPLWLGIQFMGAVIRDFPTQQLSETWIGLLTGEGELCYGSQTSARLDKALLLKLPYRALTPINVHNKGQENFILERMSIPAPFMSLYEGEDQLVTEPLSIVLEPETQQAAVKIGHVGQGETIASPRKHSDSSLLGNAWESLFT